MSDITVLMTRYRECSRHLWNTYFSDKEDVGSALDTFGVGSRYFVQGQYQESIQPYQQALDLEKQQPKLEKNLWRVLVDNLGMAYGITGDLNNMDWIHWSLVAPE